MAYVNQSKLRDCVLSVIDLRQLQATSHVPDEMTVNVLLLVVAVTFAVGALACVKLEKPEKPQDSAPSFLFSARQAKVNARGQGAGASPRPCRPICRYIFGPNQGVSQ